MIGLLRKDLIMIWAYCRMFLLMVAIFLAVSCFSQEENSFFTIYPMIIGMIIPVSLISIDERSKWNVACDAMPVSRAKFVSSKYLLTLLSVLTVGALSMLAQAVRMSRTGSPASLWDLPGLLLPIGLMGPGLLLPVIFWLGVEKGRIFYFALVGLVCVACVTLGNVDLAAAGSGELPGGLIVLASVVLFALSWALSVFLYRRREL
ncbi:MAG: ABC-2 transporter permease [Oscillospiraceae bacterium]|nr:ABC-2 transporter permease [Oscillospiraceae bacterium]